ncbi:MAG TPA: alanine--glyoxylate aminotransferase family protein [Elusimicrobiota bacterium]|jgi:aspartate aminotransferase-like enzyme|nr:alanine--glyoxylate aminotransferase family protein [Elusimicrobiota bacterium]
MEYILLTPGPTPLPPSVYKKMSEPILHHRTAEFGQLFGRTIADLQYVYRTKNSVLMLTSSGTGGMEAAVANLLSPGDKALAHTTGAFGERFVKILKAYGLSPVVVAEEWGSAADPEKLKKALKENPGVKAVFLQHTDTSTGIVNDLKTLAKVVRENSEALVVVDSISGLGAEELEADAWNLDVVVAASQKGLMCAPGLAFFSVSERAWKAAEAAKLPRFYLDWRTMRDSLPKKETPYTPAVTLVAAQAEALRLIREEGIEAVWKRTADLAAFTRAEIKKLGLKLYSKDPADILTAAWLPEGTDGKKLIGDILKEEKISIAGGQGKLEGKIVRVAHMGYIKKSDVEAGLKSLARRLNLAYA